MRSRSRAMHREPATTLIRFASHLHGWFRSSFVSDRFQLRCGGLLPAKLKGGPRVVNFRKASPPEAVIPHRGTCPVLKSRQLSGERDVSGSGPADQSDVSLRREIQGGFRATQMSARGVRREKVALSSGCKSHPANAPAGSNRSSHGGNEMSEAFG
jgi:hypothetical protein